MAATKNVIQLELTAVDGQSLKRTPQVRIYDPSILDSNYTLLERTSHRDPVKSFGYLFVYNPGAGVTHPRMVELSGKGEGDAELPVLPAIMGSDITNPHWHIWTSTVIVDVSIEMLPLENSTVGASGRGPGSKRLHWCVNFGPSICTFNSKGLVPDRVAIPGSDRFAELYAIGRALEKAYEMLSYAKGIKPIRASLGGGRRKQVELNRESAECLMSVTEFVVLVGDQPLMRWLGETFDTMEASDVVQTLCGTGEILSTDSIEYRKALQMVEWVTKLVQKLEMELSISVTFWGIYEAHNVLIERKHNQRHNPEEIRVRSPSPQPPLLSTLRDRTTLEGYISESGETSSSLDQPASVSRGGQSTRAINAPAYNSTPSRSSWSAWSGSPSRSSTCSSSPLETVEALKAYILRKYPGNPTDPADKPWATDREVLLQQSQIVQPAPIVAKLKRKREVLVSTNQSRQTPQLKRARATRVIVDVSVGPDGKEVYTGRWKGPKKRKVVEIDVPELGLASGDIRNSPMPQLPAPVANDYAQSAQASTELQPQVTCPFTMNRAWINKRSENLTKHAELPVSPDLGLEMAILPVPVPDLPNTKLAKSLFNRIKDTDCETSDTIDEGNIPDVQTCKGEKNGLGLRQVKVSKARNRIQPKRGQLSKLVSQAGPLPAMVTWDTRTTIPVKPV